MLFEDYLRTIENPMRRGKARKALERLSRYNGSREVQHRHSLIEARVREGYRIESRKGEEILASPNGVWLDAKNITKEGLSFAKWLINKG